MTQSVTTELTLYYREGCHLCDDMAFSLQEMIAETRWSIRRIDIDRDEALRRRFNADVPLLFLGDTMICRHFLDRVALERTLGDAVSRQS